MFLNFPAFLFYFLPPFTKTVEHIGRGLLFTRTEDSQNVKLATTIRVSPFHVISPFFLNRKCKKNVENLELGTTIVDDTRNTGQGCELVGCYLHPVTLIKMYVEMYHLT